MQPGQVCEAPPNTSHTFRYRAYLPQSEAAGLVAYLPHFGATIDEWETALLPERLTARGIAVIVGLAVAGGTGFLTDADLGALDAMLHDAIRRVGCPVDRLVLGGFSAGGVGAFRYAEVAVEGRVPGLIRPRALFAVDPPLDVRRWYRGMASIVSRQVDSILLGEATFLCGMLRDLFGGTPEEVPAAYANASAVSADQPLAGNLRHLKDVPVRLYTEPDVAFWQAYGADLYCLNALDVVYAATELRAMGNTEVELIVTSGKGFRPDLGGMRMPHAWSIVDEADLADWIEKRLSSVAP